MLLGNNAASIKIKKARFFAKFLLEKTAFYGLDTKPDLELALVETGTVINSNGSATLTVLLLR
jgi:hypothetical protein